MWPKKNLSNTRHLLGYENEVTQATDTADLSVVEEHQAQGVAYSVGEAWTGRERTQEREGLR